MRHFFKNIKKMFRWIPRIWKIQFWDYGYMQELLIWYLEDMLESFEQQEMVDSVQVETEIKRSIFLLRRLHEDHYIEHVGYQYPKRDNFELTEDERVELVKKTNEARELRQKEHDELFNILQSRYETWWW